MILPLTLLVVSAVVIYLSCEVFVNGVEWVGRKAGIAENAVGTVLAAFGTALPESVVTLVAVAFSGGSIAAKEIGVGAALGGPLILSTVAYAVVGVVMWLVRRSATSHSQVIHDRRLARDQGWFLIIFIFKVGLGFVVFAAKPLLGAVFLLIYAIYSWTEVRSKNSEDIAEPLAPLRLRPRSKDPRMGWAIAQTLGALLFIFGGSQLFVRQLEHLGPALGLPPTLVALLLSPIATELPETLNAVIWVRQGKHRLALANISGAMMIQATVPSAFGLFFTAWLFDGALAWAAIITTASVLGLFFLFKRNALTPQRLAAFALFYVVFLVGLVVLWRMGAATWIPNPIGRPGI
jgi:cation:H+ antiporter